MLNSYHNFVCDQNSYTNEINFARHTFFMYITSIYKKSQYVKLQGHGYNKFGSFNSHCFIGFLSFFLFLFWLISLIEQAFYFFKCIHELLP